MRMSMRGIRLADRCVVLALAALAGAVTVAVTMWPANRASAQAEAVAVQPHVVAATPIDAGRYLVQIGGCNDCHTADFDITGGNVPEDQWLLGTAIAWSGPWGSTYASNLRLHVQEFNDAATWVMVMRARKERPPMPWPSLHAMSDADLTAIFHYIRSLGPAGGKMPEFVPPDQQPATPYRMLAPVFPPAETAG
jgi:mono/diheme cytochrome c family protein